MINIEELKTQLGIKPAYTDRSDINIVDDTQLCIFAVNYIKLKNDELENRATAMAHELNMQAVKLGDAIDYIKNLEDALGNREIESARKLFDAMGNMGLESWASNIIAVKYSRPNTLK